MSTEAPANPRITEPLPRTLVALTFATGMLDAISFLGLGQVFAAMMTGNVLFLGFGIAGAGGSSLVAPLVAIAAFVGGGLIGGMLAVRARDRPSRGLLPCLGLEVVLLGAAAAFAAAVDVETDELTAWVLIATVALAMGARNTAVRRIGLRELPTMVLTVAVASFEAGTSFAGASPSHLVPRAVAVGAMLSGAVAGALLLEGPGLAASLVAAAGLTLVAGAALAAAVREGPG
jgi:uncharacterized membrane protein YoaK (UPF0700 family)